MDERPRSIVVKLSLWKWVNANIFQLFRQMRISYLPPLMIYMAAGVSSLTAIVGTFFVKDHLGFSAEFLATLGFWAGIPWALKMPVGHVVDLLWQWKSFLVFLGAALIAASFAIMLGLIGQNPVMAHYMRPEAWFVSSALLAPLGYVIQDIVADAMTVEAVPRVNDQGVALDPKVAKVMHTTMQTLGRVAIVGGGILVSLTNLSLFRGANGMTESEKVHVYLNIYRMAMAIPIMSVLGVILAALLKGIRVSKLRRLGLNEDHIRKLVDSHGEAVSANGWLLGGGFVFVIFTLAMGLGHVPFNQEIILAGSLAIILFLMARLLKELEPGERRSLVGTAIIIFIFRALPGPGAGSSWWQIDELGFDQQFFSNLSLINSGFALLGMFVFRRFMAEKSIAYVVGFLTIIGTLLSLPIMGLYFGMHKWTSALTGGIADARFIALVDTALESPLGQVAMIPMLAWIAQSAPPHLKATYFAVMASFTNLALSLSNLGTKYLNQLYVVSRQVVDPVTHVVKIPANYGQLGSLLIMATALGFLLPMVTILVIQKSPLRSRSES